MTCQYYVYDPLEGHKYCKNADGDQIYIARTGVREQYAADTNGLLYYARDRYENETPYFELVNGQRVYEFIVNSMGEAQYPKNKDGEEFYPQDVDGAEILVRESPIHPKLWRYAKKKSGERFYPKDKDKNEYVVDRRIINDKNNNPVHPLDSKSMPKYPVDTLTGDEFYIKNPDGGYFMLKNKEQDDFYAKKSNLDQFFPPDNQPAISKDRTKVFYPVTASGEAIFPKRQNSEYYLRFISDDCDAVDVGDKKLHRYALDASNNELYPRESVVTHGQPQMFREAILNETYAKLNDGTKIYPLDENGNEYTMDPTNKNLADVFPLGYPMTNDNFIIVPRYQNKPFINPNIISNVQESHLVGLLYRATTGYFDYLSTVKSRRISRSLRKMYKTIPIPPPVHPPVAINPAIINPPVVINPSIINPPVLTVTTVWYGWYYIAALAILVILVFTSFFARNVSEDHAILLAKEQQRT